MVGGSSSLGIVYYEAFQLNNFLPTFVDIKLLTLVTLYESILIFLNIHEILQYISKVELPFIIRNGVFTSSVSLDLTKIVDILQTI
jgi:hypothetical protein